MEGGAVASMRWIKLRYHAAWRLVMVDEGLELSGYIAFTAFLSLFPFLIFLAALAGFLGDRETADAFIDAMFEFMPADVAKTLAPAVREVVGARQGGLLTFGILATLWFASNGFEALRTGLNRAYGVAEQRAMLVAAPAEHRIRDRWRPTHSLPLAGGHPRPAGLERARSRRGSRTRDAPDVRHGALFVRRRAAVRRAHLVPSLAAQHEAGVCAHLPGVGATTVLWLIRGQPVRLVRRQPGRLCGLLRQPRRGEEVTVSVRAEQAPPYHASPERG
jgi:hypothetical protein